MAAVQKTLQGPVDLEGPGLFTGKPARILLRPAAPDTGIVFVRPDLPSHPRMPVTPETVRIGTRNVKVASAEAEVESVEHLLSALNGMGIDNCEIEVSGPEIPAGDGSSRAFVELIQRAGVAEQAEPRREVVISEPVSVTENGSSLVALPSDKGLRISYTIEYPDATIARQHISLSIDEATYRREVADARTFCLKSEADELLRNGLGLGGNTQNTIVVGDKGVIDTQLRFPDEFVRHKVLDLIGALAAIGPGLRAHIVAIRSGHREHITLAQKLAHAAEGPAAGDKPAETLLDVRELWKILPHRYPFLMIDRVVEMDGYRKAVGIKNVTINEPFFQGHFPGQPIMPGVLMLEAMAQLAGALLMRRSENARKVPVLLSMDGVKFRKNVIPGDQLIVETEVLKLKQRTAEVLGRAKVTGQLAVEATMKFMIIDQGSI